MNKFLCLPVLVASLGFLAGCGNNDDNSAQKIRDQFNNSRSGSCGQNVVFDYNDVVQTCNSVGSVLPNSPDLSDCESTADSFLDKYPSINCVAERNIDSSVDDEQFTINEQLIESIVEAAKN